MNRKDASVWSGRALALGTSVVGLVAGCGGGGGGGGGGGPDPVELAALGEAQLLIAIDPATGAMTARSGAGPAGHANAHAMALDPSRDELYLIDQGLLLRVAAKGGAKGLEQEPVAIGSLDPLHLPDVLAWDPVSRQLFGVKPPPNKFSTVGTLVRIDPSTAATVPIGACTAVTSLTWDTASGSLYGVRSQWLVRIDPLTGGSTMLFEEFSLLPFTEGLISDPLTGLFQAVHNPVGGPSGVVSIALNGQVALDGAIAFALDGIVLDADSGRRFGLTPSKVLLELASGAPYADWRPLGILGVEVIALTFDANERTYFGVSVAADLSRTLVKLDPLGRSRPIAVQGVNPTGRMNGDIQSLAFDSLTGELWGFDGTSRRLVSIDPVTAQTSVQSLTFSQGTNLTIDPATGTYYAYDPAAEVTLLVDPHGPSATILSNQNGPTNLDALDFDASSGRLVAVWDTDSSTGIRTEFSAWLPTASGVATGVLAPEFSVWALGSDSVQRLMHAFGPCVGGNYSGGELFAVDLAGTAEPRSVGSLWNRQYEAAVRAESLSRGFAIDGEDVFAFDLVTGETEFIGSTPSGGGALGITWDPERSLLGFLEGDAIRWSAPNATHVTQQVHDLGNVAFDSITRDPASGLYFACGAAGLSSIAINATGAVVLPIGPLPAGVVVRDIALRSGRLFAATQDQRLFRIDTATGMWTDMGRTNFAVNALY